MSGDAGLVDSRTSDKIVDLLLPAAQRFHDAEASRVGKNLKGLYIHIYVYAC